MPEPIPVEEYHNLVKLRELAVSPNGSRVAFVVSEADSEAEESRSSILVVPANGGEAPYRLTRASEASSPKWSPDGSQLAFLAEREEDLARTVGLDGGPSDIDSDEGSPGRSSEADSETQVWAFDVRRGGDARQLTDRDHGVREFDWGPNGERIVISARDPTDDEEAALEQRKDGGPIEIERLQHKADGIGFTDEVTTYLFVVDLRTDEEHRLEQAYGAGATEPDRGLHPKWNPVTDEVAFVTNPGVQPDNSLESDVFTVDVGTGAVSRITNGDSIFVRPEWSPNGELLSASGRDASNWFAPADVIVAEADTGEWQSVTGDLDATVTWFEMPQFIDEKTILGGFGDEGWSRFYRLPTDLGDPTPLDVGIDTDQSLRQFDVAADTLVFSVTDPARGHDIHVTDLEGPGTEELVSRRLTDLNRDPVAQLSMPDFQRTRTASETVTVESMCYYPDSFDPDDPEPHPLILSIHGGPMTYEDPAFNFPAAYFASRGYLVCKPNYRGSTSYGREFADVLRGERGTVEVEDLRAVIDDFVDRGWADHERLFSMGFSYGATASVHLITQTDRLAAAAAEHGTYDLRSDFGTSDYHAWTSVEFGLPWEQPELFEGSSSITGVGAISTPTLLIAGGDDHRCPPSQSEQLYVSLRKRGVPTKLVIYPYLNHRVGQPKHVVHRLESVAAWFREHDPTQ